MARTRSQAVSPGGHVSLETDRAPRRKRNATSPKPAGVKKSSAGKPKRGPKKKSDQLPENDEQNTPNETGEHAFSSTSDPMSGQAPTTESPPMDRAAPQLEIAPNETVEHAFSSTGQAPATNSPPMDSAAPQLEIAPNETVEHAFSPTGQAPTTDSPPMDFVASQPESGISQVTQVPSQVPQVPSQVPQVTTQVASQVSSLVASQDNSQVSSQDTSQAASQDNPQVSSQDTPQAASQDNPQVSSQDTPQAASQDNPQVSSQDTPQAASQNNPQVSSHPHLSSSVETPVTPDDPDVVMEDVPGPTPFELEFPLAFPDYFTLPHRRILEICAGEYIYYSRPSIVDIRRRERELREWLLRALSREHQFLSARGSADSNSSTSTDFGDPASQLFFSPPVHDTPRPGNNDSTTSPDVDSAIPETSRAPENTSYYGNPASQLFFSPPTPDTPQPGNTDSTTSPGVNTTTPETSHASEDAPITTDTSSSIAVTSMAADMSTLAIASEPQPTRPDDDTPITSDPSPSDAITSTSAPPLYGSQYPPMSTTETMSSNTVASVASVLSNLEIGSTTTRDEDITMTTETSSSITVTSTIPISEPVDTQMTETSSSNAVTSTTPIIIPEPVDTPMTTEASSSILAISTTIPNPQAASMTTGSSSSTAFAPPTIPELEDVPPTTETSSSITIASLPIEIAHDRVVASTATQDPEHIPVTTETSSRITVTSTAVEMSPSVAVTSTAAQSEETLITPETSPSPAYTSAATQTLPRSAYTSTSAQTSTRPAYVSTGTQTSFTPEVASTTTQTSSGLTEGDLPCCSRCNMYLSCPIGHSTHASPESSPSQLLPEPHSQDMPEPPSQDLPQPEGFPELTRRMLVPRIPRPSFPRLSTLECYREIKAGEQQLTGNTVTPQKRARHSTTQKEDTENTRPHKRKATGSSNVARSNKRARDSTTQEDGSENTRPQKRRATGSSNVTRTNTVGSRTLVLGRAPVASRSSLIRRNPTSLRPQTLSRPLPSQHLFRRNVSIAETRRRVAAQNQGRIHSSTTFQLPQLIAQNEADRRVSTEIQESVAPVSQTQTQPQPQVERETAVTGSENAEPTPETPRAGGWGLRSLFSRFIPRIGHESGQPIEEAVEVAPTSPTRQQGDGAARPRSPVDVGARPQTVTPLGQQARMQNSGDLTYALLPEPIDKSSYLAAAATAQEEVNALPEQSCQPEGDQPNPLKRKWSSSLKEIPNPPGCSYGMDLDYFCYSSEEEEGEEDNGSPGVSVEAEPRSPTPVTAGSQTPPLASRLLPSPPATGPTTPTASSPKSHHTLPIWDEEVAMDDVFSRDAEWMYQQTPSGDLGLLPWPSEDRYADTVGADTMVLRCQGEGWNEQHAQAGFVHFCRDFERF